VSAQASIASKHESQTLALALPQKITCWPTPESSGSGQQSLALVAGWGFEACVNSKVQDRTDASALHSSLDVSGQYRF
jgi:hypothetical protein